MPKIKQNSQTHSEMGKNSRLNIGRETILSSTNRIQIQMDTAMYKLSKKLRRETVRNKSQGIKVLKVADKYSKQETIIIHTAI